MEKNIHEMHGHGVDFDTEDEGPIVGGAIPIEPGLIGLLAGIAGLAVASLYYSQPMLAVIAESVGASEGAIGLVPMLTQLGYALGILLLAPLGDRIDRRQCQRPVRFDPPSAV